MHSTISCFSVKQKATSKMYSSYACYKFTGIKEGTLCHKNQHLMLLAGKWGIENTCLRTVRSSMTFQE